MVSCLIYSEYRVIRIFFFYRVENMRLQCKGRVQVDLEWPLSGNDYTRKRGALFLKELVGLVIEP